MRSGSDMEREANGTAPKRSIRNTQLEETQYTGSRIRGTNAIKGMSTIENDNNAPTSGARMIFEIGARSEIEPKTGTARGRVAICAQRVAEMLDASVGGT